jgi:hypothetical protein
MTDGETTSAAQFQVTMRLLRGQCAAACNPQFFRAKNHRGGDESKGQFRAHSVAKIELIF